jgi:hypothetical protein
MNQLMGFGFENKHNKQSLKIYSGTLGLLNVIKQLQHFIILKYCAAALTKTNRENKNVSIILYNYCTSLSVM